MDCMIDLETLDTTASAVILSVGVVKFDPRTDQTPVAKQVWRPALNEQLEKGRTTSDSTLAWWARQDPEIRNRALSEQDRISVTDLLAEINRYMTGVGQIWAQGPQFDLVILEHLFQQWNTHTNWQYWQIRDSRTLFSLMPEDPRKAIQQDAHDAGEDAYWQAVAVQLTHKHFGLYNG